MKARKCPYCGRRIPYFTVFDEKKQGEHICRRCGKESKIVVKKNIYGFFLLAIICSAVIATLWIALGYINRPLGILLVAVPLVIFYFLTPGFIKILPLKKYKKSMEAAKAAREYSSEIQYKQNYSTIINTEENKTVPVMENNGDFTINSQVFSSIKANRKKPVTEENNLENAVSGKTVIVEKKAEKFVPVIEKNSEAHASSSENVPLQKIHKEKPQYIESSPRQEDVKIYSKRDDSAEKKKKAEGSKYSSNRRF